MELSYSAPWGQEEALSDMPFLRGERVDELDRKIMATLSRDGRTSNRQIAADLQVTEGTIRTRLRRLQNEGLIQFTVVTDFRLAGSPNLVIMGINAEPGQVTLLAQEIAAIREIGCVVALLGRYDLMAMGLFTSVEQMHELIQTRIRPLRGVRHIDLSISVGNLKYDAAIARITDRTAP